MTVLVDTPVWSLAFRQRGSSPSNQDILDEFSELVHNNRAYLIGPIRQEVLSGIKDDKQYKQFRAYMRAFEDLPVITYDYEEAAQIHNLCRRNGVQGSHIDFLICAVAQRYSASIFTVDREFSRYAKFVDITLHALG